MRRGLSAVVALLATTAAVVSLAVSLGGCLATTDEAPAWRETARVAAGDAHSQLRTVRLVLTERDGLLGRYDVSVVWDAEEAVGSASEDLSKSQPPGHLRPTYDRLGYDRREEQGPWLLAGAVRWLHRHSVSVAVEDVQDIDWTAREVRCSRSGTATR